MYREDYREENASGVAPSVVSGQQMNVIGCQYVVSGSTRNLSSQSAFLPRAYGAYDEEE
jgi:hypothetical protein